MASVSRSVLLSLALASSPCHAGPCFTQEDNQRLSFPVVVNAPPPNERDMASYRYYPATAVASMNLHSLRTSDVAEYWFQWANRCQGARGTAECSGNQKGNVPLNGPGLEREHLRTLFSTRDRADACTLLQAEIALGSRDDAAPALDRHGLVMASEADLAARPPTEPLAPDTCPMPDPGSAAVAKGIMLDYEVQDGRTPAQTLDFLQRFSSLVKQHGKTVFLYTNPLNAPTQVKTGIDASNIHGIYEVFDAISIQLFARNREGDLTKSFADQRDLIQRGGPIDAKRVFVVFELNETTIKDASEVHAIMRNAAYRFLMLWRNGATVGDACDTPASRKIACATLGQCSN